MPECSCHPLVTHCPVHGLCECARTMRRFADGESRAAIRAADALFAGQTPSRHLSGCPLDREGDS